MIISNNFMLQKKWKQTTAFLSKSNGNVSTQLQYGPPVLVSLIKMDNTTLFLRSDTFVKT